MTRLRLNPFCDVVLMGRSVQFRLPTKVTVFQGQSLSKVVQAMLPLFYGGFTIDDAIRRLEEYEEEDIRRLVDRLLQENILAGSFPKNIIDESSLSFGGSTISAIKNTEKGMTDVNVGVIDVGNIAFCLAELLSMRFGVTLFQVKEFSYSGNNWSGGTRVEIPFALLLDFAERSRFDYVIFLPEGLGIADQKKLEKTLGRKLRLIMGFRKDAIYYVASVGNIDSVFLRIFRGLSLREDWLIAKHILTSRDMILRRTYFGISDARWIASDLASEIVSFVNRNGESNLVGHVIIYDLPLSEKRASRFVELPERISPPLSDILLQSRQQETAHQELERLREKFVGEATILPEVERVDLEQSRFSLPFYLYLSRYSSPNSLFISQREPLLATGASKDNEQAELKAIIEGLERYASGVYDSESLKLAEAIQLDEEYVDPHDVVAYHPSQYTHDFPLRPFNKTEKFLWKKCFNLSQNKPVYLIADCVFYPFYFGKRKGTKLYTFSNSSGVAAHFIWEHAVRTAILELCERDAFMIVWFNKLSMPRLDNASLPEHLRLRIETINSFGFEVYLLDITMDLFPVVLAAAVNESSSPAFICGAACSVDAKEAAEKALMEVEIDLHTLHVPGLSPKTVRNLRDISFPSDHASLYYDRSNVERVKFLFQSPAQVSLEEIAKSVEMKGTLEELHSYLVSKGLQVIVANLTPPDVLELDPYIQVVRVFVPKLVPIYFGAGLEPLGIERLFALPRQLGLSNIVLDYEMVDRFPHPFP